MIKHLLVKNRLVLCCHSGMVVNNAFFFSSQVSKKITNLLVKLKNNIFFVTAMRTYLCFLFGLRALFVKESPWTFPLLALGIEVIYYLSLTSLPHQSLYVILGINLIAYDNLGSLFAQVFDENVELATVYLVIPGLNKPLRRFTSFKAFIIGKTAMSSTGRASIVVGATVLGETLLNSYFDRKAMDARAKADRETMNEQSAKARAYQNYQDALKEYKSCRFYNKKGEKPHWDEEAWKLWSKS